MYIRLGNYINISRLCYPVCFAFFFNYYFLLKASHLSSKKVKTVQALSQYVKRVQFVYRRYLKLGGTFSVKDELSPHKTLLASPLLLLGGARGRKVAY